ncbi:MAG: TetR/AcrR family transcriptional regulator [Lachnospiraceae bacterium]|jgi:AcrR family transcriptional regulator|nr:TetR/AcrR family transcriptional regulator [Lachnospiraceae bacterium]
MPKQTFFNLAPGKRAAIAGAALAEFAHYGYDGSNINRIVAASRIAKGSFYQYFEDKKDLYFHLVDAMVEKKLAVLNPVADTFDQHTFAQNMERVFLAGYAFADSDPQMYAIGEDFVKKQPAFIAQFMERYSHEAQDFYLRLLECAGQRGELREGLDLQVTAHFIYVLCAHVPMELFRADREFRDICIRQLVGFVSRAVTKA